MRIQDPAIRIGRVTKDRPVVAELESEVTKNLQAILNHVDQNTDEALERLFELLKIPSISTDPEYSGHCRDAAETCRKFLAEIGFEAQVCASQGQPMVLAHWRSEETDNKPRLLFYGHYDVQPADPLDLWQTPPFEPYIRDDPKNGQVIVARGASDDKGQLMTFLEACRSWKQVTGTLPANITVLLEGEEESGSPSLGPFLESYKEQLQADIALVCDTGQWDTKTPAVTTMLRGMAFTEFVIKGPSRDLHSGMYGGPAMNPIRGLARVLSSFHDENGRVSVEGFYDGIVDPTSDQLSQWQDLNFDASAFLSDVGLHHPAGESSYSVLEQLWSRPTLEVNGLIGGYTGPGSKTVIPSIASAKITCRLVPGQDPAHILEAIKAHVNAHVPADCTAEFIKAEGSPAVQFDTNSEAILSAAAALEDEFGTKPVMMGCGGSIPIVESFQQELGLNALLVGFGLEDDQIHSPNEKYNLSSFNSGRRAWVRILSKLTE